MATYYVGLDVQLKHTTICILDQEGKRVKRLTIRGAWSKIADELKRLTGKVSVCYEASSCYGYLLEFSSVGHYANPNRREFQFHEKQDRSVSGTSKWEVPGS